MKNISRYIGAAGILAVLAGSLSYYLKMHWAYFSAEWAVGLVALAVYVTFNLSDIRAFLFSRAARYGAGSVFSIVLVLGIIAFISVMNARHSAQWDVTKNKRYSLSPQTVKVLEGLADPILVTGFFQEGGPDKNMARDLLTQYARVSAEFKYELIDPNREPARAQAANVTSYGTVIMKLGEREERLYSLSEEQVTNAIIRVLRPNKKRIYFLSGHGEKDIDDTERTGYGTVRKILEDQNYDVKKLILMQVEDVPLDASVLVVAGPRKDPFPNELEAIERYLKRRGKVIFLVDPETVPELSKFLVRFKVKLGNDIVIDKLSRIYGGDYRMPVITQYTAHPITKNFTLASFFPLARTVTVMDDEVKGVSAVNLARTENQAWGETNMPDLRQGQAQFDEGEDLAGPVSVAAVGAVQAEKIIPKKDEKTDEEEDGNAPRNVNENPGSGNFVVFGDSDFVSNSYINLQG
ncbi:MAG: GldG family protein, partial [Deltaproteobacteria bacterium]|nr:GldG family protein [Deltaproteobacteria bacterium]